jgi:hypothetical protein
MLNSTLFYKYYTFILIFKLHNKNFHEYKMKGLLLVVTNGRGRVKGEAKGQLNMIKVYYMTILI